MLILENDPLLGGNINSVLCQATSHHPVTDSFLIKACPLTCYSLLIMLTTAESALLSRVTK